MSHVAPTLARQALRIASRRYPASAAPRASLRVAATLGANGQRSYVTESKPSKAAVNMDTTIQAEKKAFFNETGSRPGETTMPSTGMSADAMMSPTAGTLR
jgi:cysteine desulfurase